MKKLYALVFLIINFNQILCSANNKTSGLLDISLGRVITIYKERLFVDLEIEYSGAKYVKLLRLPESVVDKTTTVDGTTNYSFKPGAMRVLLSLLIVKLNNESFLSSLNQKSPKSYFNTSDYVDEISLTGLIAKAAAEVAKAAAEAAKVAKVAKVASLETLAKELGVKESDLRSMGVSNWVRVNVLRGKPLAEDQRFLLRLQKAFIKKLRSSSIGKDNAIKSLTALLDINNLLTDESHRLTIKDIFNFLTVSVRKKVMTELMNQLKTIPINEVSGNDTMAVGDSPAKTLLRLFLKNITDLDMRSILVRVAERGSSDRFDNLLSYVLENPTAEFSYKVDLQLITNVDGTILRGPVKVTINRGQNTPEVWLYDNSGNRVLSGLLPENVQEIVWQTSDFQ